MDKASRLQLAKDMLSEHVGDSLPKNIKIDNVDLPAVDAHICNLVATLLRFDGDVEETNRFYQKGGSRDYKSMVTDVQVALDIIIPKLPDFESRKYFTRLGRLSILIAEISINEEAAALDSEANDETTDENARISEEMTPVTKRGEEWVEDIRITADLDDALLEFRKMLKKGEHEKKEGDMKTIWLSDV